MNTRAGAVLGAIGLLSIASLYSFSSHGVIFQLFQASADSQSSLDRLRAYITGWGAFGPVVYVGLVVVEVLIAPIPGTLLYAPGGAIFGGFLGGTLSLVGNVTGAMLATAIAGTWRDGVARAIDAKGLARYRDRIAARGGWVIFLLRVNPLTSSDLVSYAAGLVGVAWWKVGLGTLAGMAPLCYAQSYLADRIFRFLPGSIWIVLLLGMAYVVTVVWIVFRGVAPRRSPGQSSAREASSGRKHP